MTPAAEEDFGLENALMARFALGDLAKQLEQAQQEARGLELKLFEVQAELSACRDELSARAMVLESELLGAKVRHEVSVNTLLAEISTLRASLNDAERQLRLLERGRGNR